MHAHEIYNLQSQESFVVISMLAIRHDFAQSLKMCSSEAQLYSVLLFYVLFCPAIFPNVLSLAAVPWIPVLFYLFYLFVLFSSVLFCSLIPRLSLFCFFFLLCSFQYCNLQVTSVLFCCAPFFAAFTAIPRLGLINHPLRFSY